MHRYAIALSFLLSVAATYAATDMTGVVVDANSSPIAAAHVYVYKALPKTGASIISPYSYRDCGKHVPVDAKGSFVLKNLDPSLRFDLLAVADGYEPAFAKRVEAIDGPVSIKLSPRPASDASRLITGVVVDPNGKLVVGAIVEPNGYRFERFAPDGHFIRSIASGRIPGVDRLSITNAKGEFALHVPEPNATLDVRVTARSLAPRIERNLVPGQPRTIELTEGATISGHVLKGGKPVKGARVVVLQRDRSNSNDLGRFEIGTNNDGFFLLPNLGPNETYTVDVHDESLGDDIVETRQVKVGDTNTITDLGTLAVVRGGSLVSSVR
jgi:hypothetical protein